MTQVNVSYPWQQAVFDRFRQMRTSHRLAHGILLHGAAGLGKRELAATIAGDVLGESVVLVNGVLESAHSGLRWIDLEEESRQIKIAQIRALAEFMYATAANAGTKVGVIMAADQMNASSANALLKLLEEPPRDSLLLLVANRPRALLPTVRSRCFLLPLSLTDRSQGPEYLRRVQPEAAEADIQYALWLADGAPLVAESLLRAGEVPVVRGWLSSLLVDEADWSALQYVQRHNLLLALDAWLRTLVDAGLQRSSPHAPEFARSRQFNRVSRPAQVAFMDELLWCRRLLLGTTNANPSLMLTELLSRWFRLN